MNKASGTWEIPMNEPTFDSGSQKERREEKRTERVLKEIMAKNAPKLAKHTNVHIQEAEQTSNRIKPGKSMARHIITKLPQTKNTEKI